VILPLLVKDIRSSIKATLEEVAEYEVATCEKTPLAKTVRTCRQLLKVESLRTSRLFEKPGGAQRQCGCS